MAKQEIGYRANMGTPTLILIFMILCLVTFGMLSLSTAKSEWNLAQRNADSVAEYYRADKEGEVFYQMVLQNSRSGNLGDYYDSQTGSHPLRFP